MFGDFGGSSHRHRVPSRENSPFGAFNRSQPPSFLGRGWDEEGPFQRSSSPNMQKPTAAAPSNSSTTNRERIIPIQIIGAPTQPEQQAQHAVPLAQTEQPIVLGGPKEVAGDAGEKKYSTQRHNTTDNVKLKTPESEKQRAKSEPPLQRPSSSGTSTPPPKATETPAPPPPTSTHEEPQSNGIGMTQFGGSQSKNKTKENGAGGCRNIPIIVEGRGAGGGSPPKKSQTPTQLPQKNRFQPDHCEPSTTPPPPPKKVTKDPIQIIQEIVEEVQNIEKEVVALPPTPKTAKNYIYLDEMLTRNLIKLDTIETEGKEDIRQTRRDCIKLIQKVISILEGKSAETALVPFTGNNSTPPEPAESSALVPLTQIDLALTPTPTREVARADAAMEISPTSSDCPTSVLSRTNNAITDEPMAIEEKVTA